MTCDSFIGILEKNGISFFTGVPDTLLGGFSNLLSNRMPRARHVIAANEGGAIAIASGYHIATGKIPWCTCRIPDLQTLLTHSVTCLP